MIPETDSLASKQIGVAVIRDDRDLILIDRRLAKGLLGGFWEFPGGKIEGNETVQECIKREVLEEIGIEIAVDSHLITIDAIGGARRRLWRSARRFWSGKELTKPFFVEDA